MKSILLKVVCLTLLLGITYGYRSSIFDDTFPSSDLDDPTDEWFPADIFDDFDRMLIKMREEFRQISAKSTSTFKQEKDDTSLIKKKLANVKPVCTTTGKSNSNKATPSSIQNNRRKRFQKTQTTTTCIREKIIDGTKYIQTEKKVTDGNGKIISDSNNYQSYTSSSNNAFSSTDEHHN